MEENTSMMLTSMIDRFMLCYCWHFKSFPLACESLELRLRLDSKDHKVREK